MDIQTVTEDIKKISQDINFPAHKDDVVNQAKQKGANSDTVQTLEQLPAQNFGSMGELVSKLPVGDIMNEAKKFL